VWEHTTRLDSMRRKFPRHAQSTSVCQIKSTLYSLTVASFLYFLLFLLYFIFLSYSFLAIFKHVDTYLHLFIFVISLFPFCYSAFYTRSHFTCVVIFSFLCTWFIVCFVLHFQMICSVVNLTRFPESRIQLNAKPNVPIRTLSSPQPTWGREHRESPSALFQNSQFMMNTIYLPFFPEMRHSKLYQNSQVHVSSWRYSNV
jgi:hypothetical protein